jgi:adenine-specific DNA-methyltransferase
MPRFGPMSDAAATHSLGRQKELGAFYTPPAMAAALTEWAIRTAADRVLDPSFGGLVFLAAARKRLEELGAGAEAIPEQLFGVDLDEDAHAAARTGVTLGVPPEHLLDRDFFEVAPDDMPAFDAVIGNPPYIRYQGFNGTAAKARLLAEESGVKLTRLASSWAPFVIHGTSFVAPGGRLAQVLPAELLHAQYASEVTDFLCRAFGRVSIAVFEERVFPGALEEVVLLFAEDRGATGLADVRLIACNTVDDVKAGLASVTTAPKLKSRTFVGRSKLLAQLLPGSAQRLYERLTADNQVRQLGEIASVDIGIVTGANRFFVLREGETDGLHPDLLQRAVCKAAHVQGARFSADDHCGLVQSGDRGLMFVADGGTTPAQLRTARAYLARGEAAGIHERYKCRIRDPWWALPLPREGSPDLLLTYCSNNYPRLAINEAGALNTNTLHGVRPFDRELSEALAAGFFNSLTLLSVELVGRSYGGGVLKLEPTEAEAVLLPPIPPELSQLLPVVDEAVRARELVRALDLIDGVVLKDVLGLDDDAITSLRQGRERLRGRRKRRGRPAR